MALEAAVVRVRAGDLGAGESLLMAHAVALNALFAMFADIAHHTDLVDHLERFTPDGRKAAEAALSGKGTEQATPVAGQLRLSGAEIKKPGAKQWTPLSDMPKAGPILRPKCPNGTDEPKPVEP